jgi:hypothetical protein
MSHHQTARDRKRGKPRRPDRTVVVPVTLCVDGRYQVGLPAALPIWCRIGSRVWISIPDIGGLNLSRHPLGPHGRRRGSARLRRRTGPLRKASYRQRGPMLRPFEGLDSS